MVTVLFITKLGNSSAISPRNAFVTCGRGCGDRTSHNNRGQIVKQVKGLLLMLVVTRSKIMYTHLSSDDFALQHRECLNTTRTLRVIQGGGGVAGPFVCFLLIK